MFLIASIKENRPNGTKPKAETLRKQILRTKADSNE